MKRRKCWSFATSRDGSRCTVGLIVAGDEPTEKSAAAMYRQFKAYIDECNCHARGKVAFVNPDEPWIVYQVDEVGQAGVVACGNAIAACAALSAQALRSPATTKNVVVPAGRILVGFSAAHIYPVIVHQRWHVDKIVVEDKSTGSNHVGLIRGVNDYWIIDGKADVNLANTIGHVEQASSTRVAIVSFDSRKPFIRFLTCGGKRQHGGLPLTGAIAVSFAARRLSWLRTLAETGEFESTAGTHKLLSIDPHSGAVDLPITEVKYERIG